MGPPHYNLELGDSGASSKRAYWPFQGEHEAHFSDIGVAALLDLPLQVKLPMISGSSNLYYMMKLSEKGNLH